MEAGDNVATCLECEIGSLQHFENTYVRIWTEQSKEQPRATDRQLQYGCGIFFLLISISEKLFQASYQRFQTCFVCLL